MRELKLNEHKLPRSQFNCQVVMSLCVRGLWSCNSAPSRHLSESELRAALTWRRNRLSQNKAVTRSLLLQINHQQLLIKLISRPEIEPLITMGMLEIKGPTERDCIDIWRRWWHEMFIFIICFFVFCQKTVKNQTSVFVFPQAGTFVLSAAHTHTQLYSCTYKDSDNNLI